MNHGFRGAATTGLVLADLTALAALRPDVAALVDGIAAPHAWVAEVGADRAATTLAGVALWGAGLWLGLGLLAATAVHLPGFLGHLARVVSRALLPATIYRVVAGAAGLGVLLAPVAAGARGASTPSPGHVATAPAIPAPGWPSDPPRSIPTLPAPTVPTSPSSAPSHASRLPAAPAAERAPAEPGPHYGPSVAHHPRPPGILVRPGDSLWRIAATDLGRRATPARVAAAWPRWYAANRAEIGPDPDLIKPAERLHAPVQPRLPR